MLTTTVKESCVNEWKIPHYKDVDSKLPRGQELKSDHFRFASLEWSLGLYPKGITSSSPPSSEGSVSLFLYLKTPGVTKAATGISFHGLKSDGSLCRLKTVFSHTFDGWLVGHGFGDWIKRDELLQKFLQPDGSLLIQCHFSVDHLLSKGTEPSDSQENDHLQISLPSGKVFKVRVCQIVFVACLNCCSCS